jgi:hypothetical protein
MKKIVLLGLLVALLPALVVAQEKVERPIWNVGDKWNFNKGSIELTNTDQDSYVVKFSDTTSAVQISRGFD